MIRKDLEIFDVLRNHYYCGIDVETSLDKGEMRLRFLQLYPFNPKHPEVKNEDVWIFDLQEIDPEDLELLKDCLFDSGVNLGVVWVGHNLKFDFKILRDTGFNLDVRHVVDTYIAHKVLTAGSSSFYQASLKECAEHYLGENLDKTLQRADWSKRTGSFLEKLVHNRTYEYMENDVRILEPLLFAIHDKVLAEPDSDQLLRVISLESRCVLVTAHIESSGFTLDVPKLKQLAEECRSKMIALERQFYSVIHLSDIDFKLGRKRRNLSRPRLNSPKLIASFLNRHGVKDPSNPTQPITSTAEGVLSRIDLSKYNDLVAFGIKTILEYRKTQKLYSSFVRLLLRRYDKRVDRIRSTFLQYSTDTGRYSSKKPNLQNLPRQKEVRECFIAPAGKKLVIADYSQIEVRVLAEICGDHRLRQIYKEGRDIYKVVAAKIFNTEYDKVTKDQRQVAKAVVLGFQYGMGAKKFMEYYNQNSDKPIDLETASKFRRDFFSVFPRLSYWHKEVGDKAVMATEQNPYISKTLIGRRRIFTDKAYSAAINAPVQGTSADITKYALLFLFFSLKNFNDAKIVNTVHDEIVVECCEEEANVMSSALKSVMEWGGFFMKHVPVVVETTVANNWSEKS